jgi:hypothetical protein
MRGLMCHKPIVETIMKHLPIISQMSLKRAYLINWNIYKAFWKRCCEVLDFLGFKGEHVMSILDKFESGYMFLSGGFILFCLSCTDGCLNFDGNDIDFYISDYNSSKLYQELKDVLGKGIVADQVKLKSDYAIISGITAIDNICFPKDTFHMMFQSILLGKLTRGDIILNSFDFDFCKNLFNADKLVVKKPFSVITKRCTITENIILQDYVRLAVNGHVITNNLRTLSRIEKYRERKFYVAVLGITKEHEEHETRTKNYISDILSKLGKHYILTNSIYTDWLRWKSKYYE